MQRRHFFPFLRPLALTSKHRRTLASLLALPFLGIFAIPAQAQFTVLSTNFDGGVPAEFSGITGVEGVQGYAGIGPSPTNVFGGNFLRNFSGGFPTGQAGTATTLTLTGLPTHTSVNLNFLLAIIDSWDGSGVGPPNGDFFNVQVDGVSIFRETFNNDANNPQSYVPPPGAALTPRPANPLGFNGTPGFVDGAYNMANEPRFQNLAHTSSTLTVSWFADGPGWEGGNGDNESFALENLVVSLNGVVLGPVLNPDNGHYYQFFAGFPTTWDQASATAAGLSFAGGTGYLATITSASEQAFLNTTFFNDSFRFPTYIGGVQPPGSPEPSSSFGWANGDGFSFTNWSPGEPNNSGSGEDVIEVLANGLWNDQNRGFVNRNFLVEFTPAIAPPPASAPEPGSLALFSAGIGMGIRHLIARRKRL